MKTPLFEELYHMEPFHWWFRARRAIIRHIIKLYFGENTEIRIIDIGCSCGYGILELSKTYNYKNVYGLDASDIAIAYSKKRGIDVIKGVLPNDIPLEKNSFDVAILLDVLEHIEDDASSAGAVVDLLKPGGLIIATVPAHLFMWTQRDEYHEHKRRYDLQQVKRIFDSLPVEKIILSYYNFILSLPVIISRILSKFFGYDKMEPDLHLPPKPINSLLEKILTFEGKLLEKMTLPAGVSIIAVYKKKTTNRQQEE